MGLMRKYDWHWIWKVRRGIRCSPIPQYCSSTPSQLLSPCRRTTREHAEGSQEINPWHLPPEPAVHLLAALMIQVQASRLFAALSPSLCHDL